MDMAKWIFIGILIFAMVGFGGWFYYNMITIVFNANEFFQVATEYLKRH